MKTKETTPGKTYSVHTSSGCTVSDQNGWSKTIDAPEGYFTAHASEVTIEGDDEASVKELFKLAPAALVSGGGSASGGSVTYPYWIGYIEYDDETGAAIAADYSVLELDGTIPESLRFSYVKFRGDWKGSIGKFTGGNYMFSDCTGLTSFTSDLSSLTDGEGMFYGCTSLTSFNSDLSSLTTGDYMFQNCKLDAPSVERILNSIPEYLDGSSHNLSMSIQSGEAAEKFGEITGTTPNLASKSVKFKGWTISVNTKN